MNKSYGPSMTTRLAIMQSDGGLANVILDVVTMINPVAGGIMKVMAAPHATGYRN